VFGKDVPARVFNLGTREAPMNESKSWRRGFAAGFAALVLSVGGHLATGEAPAESACSLSRSRLADRSDRFSPNLEARGIAQRVARAVLGLVLGTCS
jgi:hypothetical protein